MLDFPDVKEPVAPKQSKMSLKQYVEFCEFCVRSNPLITPKNCLERDSGERKIKEPFSFLEQGMFTTRFTRGTSEEGRGEFE